MPFSAALFSVGPPSHENSQPTHNNKPAIPPQNPKNVANEARLAVLRKQQGDYEAELAQWKGVAAKYAGGGGGGGGEEAEEEEGGGEEELDAALLEAHLGAAAGGAAADGVGDRYEEFQAAVARVLAASGSDNAELAVLLPVVSAGLAVPYSAQEAAGYLATMEEANLVMFDGTSVFSI